MKLWSNIWRTQNCHSSVTNCCKQKYQNKSENNVWNLSRQSDLWATWYKYMEQSPSWETTSEQISCLSRNPLHLHMSQLLDSRESSAHAHVSTYACYMPRPSHPLWFGHHNNIWLGVQIMKLAIVQFPAHC
jgi:hypothetical protein